MAAVSPVTPGVGVTLLKLAEGIEGVCMLLLESKTTMLVLFCIRLDTSGVFWLIKSNSRTTLSTGTSRFFE